MSDFRVKYLSARLVRRIGYYGTPEDPNPTLAHWCPACKSMHDFAVEKPFRNGARWAWDGNVEQPTMTPSMNIAVGPFPDGTVQRCHYFLKGGQIQYLTDCTHTMAGQTVALPDVPDEATRWAEKECASSS